MRPAQIIAEMAMNCCGPFERLNPIVWTHLGRSLYSQNLLGCFPVSLFLQGRHFFRFTVRTALEPGNMLHVDCWGTSSIGHLPRGHDWTRSHCPFFKWTQLFDLTVSLFRLLSTSQVRSVSSYVCLWKSHFNCQLAKQTVVAITGSGTENAQMLNVKCCRIKIHSADRLQHIFFKTTEFKLCSYKI